MNLPAVLLRALSPASPLQGLRHLSNWRASGYLGTGRLQPSTVDADAEPRFLVTGACGQVGGELIPYLRARVGIENVIASDVKTTRPMLESGPFVYLDITEKDHLARIAIEHGITHIIHLATLLSAVGEKQPQLALRINTAGIQNVLDLAARHDLKVYAPSTIAVFGTTTPKHLTPNDTVMQPNTMYGITKVHQELLGAYYADKFGVDYRSLRYPGIISALSPPGGGTTDYAVDIFHHALKHGKYTCFLNPGAELPMMYMPDCLDATWQLMMADKSKLTHTTYNVGAMSFSPAELAACIQEHLPHFVMECTPDSRDDIARTWPRSIDDSLARRDWNWQPRYDLPATTKDMLNKLQRWDSKKQETTRVQGMGRTLHAPNPHQHAAVKEEALEKSEVAAVVIPAELI